MIIDTIKIYLKIINLIWYFTMYNQTIVLNKKKIHLNSKPYIIAEIGSNFNQNFEKAKKLIIEAKKCGVDAVKFQLFKSEALYPNDKKMYKLFFNEGRKFFETSERSEIHVLNKDHHHVPL